MQTDQLEELLEMFNYDRREPPNWHGQVGHAVVDGGAVIIYTSWADPREGTNEERLQIEQTDQGVRVRGYDEVGKRINFVCPQKYTLSDILKRVIAHGPGGIRPLEGAIRGVRVLSWIEPGRPDETEQEF